MSDDPIFIVGTERSGSNLLRLILNTHSQIVVPHPPHIVRYFSPLVRYYGDLSEDGNFRRLVRDIHRLVLLHICPWRVSIDIECAVSTARPRSPFGVSIEFYEQCREAAGKRRWGCKSTFMIHHADEILERFPGARILYLVRDPRDVAASSKRSVFNPYHPYYTALLWREQQICGIDLLRRLSGKNLLQLRYEDLLLDPEGVTRRACDFLEETFEPAMLSYFQTEEARTCSRLSRSWSNTSSPVIRDNAGKYRRSLSPRELILVEAITREQMRHFGYSPENCQEVLESVDLGRHHLYYRLLDAAMGLRTELCSVFQDRNHWRRWARAAFLMFLRFRLCVGGLCSIRRAGKERSSC